MTETQQAGVLRLTADDVVVLETDDHLTPKQYNMVGEEARNAFAPARAVVLDGGLKLARNQPDIKVKREELTYEYGNGRSFFQDLALSELRSDLKAKARLERHQREMDVELETRTRMNTTLGTGGEFAPPLWAIDRFTTQARAGRVIADLANNLVLPPGVSSVHTPKETTGTDVSSQQQGNPVNSVDVVTADAKSDPVVTIAGESDVSIQLLEQTPSPGYDAVTYLDLSRAYNQNLETQCLSGNSASGQLTGLTNVTGRVSDVSGAGVNAAQATGFPQFWVLLGQAAAGISNTRKLPPEIFVMAPRRWFWVASATDTATRPIATVGPYVQKSDFQAAPQGASDAAKAIGAGMPFSCLGLPCYIDGAIPTTGSTEYCIAARVTDMLLYESPPKFAVQQDVLSGTLQVRLQLRRYVAFVNTKPSSICVITALPAPTAF